MRRTLLTVLTVLLFALLVVPSGASVARRYTCEMDGVARGFCCCEHVRQNPCAAPPCATDPCCDVRVVCDGSARLASQGRDLDGWLPLVGLVSIVPSPAPVRPPGRTAQPRRAAAHGPPLFVWKSAYLI